MDEVLHLTSYIIHLYSVVPGRLELPTSTLSVWRSNQLSYRTGFKLSATHHAPSFIYSLKKTDFEYKKPKGHFTNLASSLLPLSLIIILNYQLSIIN